MYNRNYYHRSPTQPKFDTDANLVAQLRTNLDAGNVRSAFGDWGVTFAADTLRKWDRGTRSFSAKQNDWIQKLANAQAKAPAAVAQTPVDVAGIVELFERAAKHLKHPKVRLQTAGGAPVVLSRAGNRSKTPGWINVTDGGRYGENRWYGKINPQTGAWELPRSGVAQDVQNVVYELSEDPAGVAARYGKITGNCCFCVKSLTDERSLVEGYGPVCAEKWGLPWGNKRRDGNVVVEDVQLPSGISREEEEHVRRNIELGYCPDGCCGAD